MCYKTQFAKTISLLLSFLSFSTYAFDTKNVSSIQFVLDEDRSHPFEFEIPKSQLIDKVSKNLAQWHYPITIDDPNYSHILTATLRNVSYQTTPIGFSFSSGNSDPRAIDFQKSDVLPIHCQLTKRDSAYIDFESTMTFSSSSILNEPNRDRFIEKLSDKISTSCFHLLEEAKISVPITKESGIAFSPIWLPDVHVELKSNHIENAQSNIIQAIEKEDNPKELIIHNQGSPLTIRFGQER